MAAPFRCTENIYLTYTIVIIVQAQLNDDSTKCSKVRCIKMKEDYEDLTAENEKTIKDLIEQLASTKIMVGIFILYTNGKFVLVFGITYD